ncbi:putative carboxylesterase 11 [Nymphaea thermarum]|nr:putative carboxylesterase 11 [Nymphaea thermarum]
MPSVAVKLYSVLFKILQKHRLQNRTFSPEEGSNPFGVTSRPEEESAVPANASFNDGVATKDIHIDALTSLSVRIFLPESSLHPPFDPLSKRPDLRQSLTRRSSYGGVTATSTSPAAGEIRRSSYGGESSGIGDVNGAVASGSNGHLKDSKRRQDGGGVYRGYLPGNTSSSSSRRLPIVLQFHGGGFVSGSKDSYANDVFCRRIAKLCEVIVIAVGYRLAPENRYPAAFEDGLKVLNWLGKQANLAECNKSLGSSRGSASSADLRKSDVHRHIVDAFGASMVEPWLATHGDPSRCVLLGVSCGANIADYVARKAVAAGNLLEPVKVVAQILMYPFFIGSVPTHSEIKLVNTYFYDKAICMLAWKLFLPEEEFSLDHPAANPLIAGREPPLKFMPPTLTVVAEHDWMRDRAIAYSEELRKVNIDAPVLEYKDAVHEFATLDRLLKTPQAQACAEDIAIWMKKYISLRGHEFSY